MGNIMPGESLKTEPQNNDPEFFINAFQKRLGRTPAEFISGKIETGSSMGAIEHYFNILSAEVSRQNNCKFFEFDYFYAKSKSKT